jgi:hypothetical protein
VIWAGLKARSHERSDGGRWICSAVALAAFRPTHTAGISAGSEAPSGSMTGQHGFALNLVSPDTRSEVIG